VSSVILELTHFSSSIQSSTSEPGHRAS